MIPDPWHALHQVILHAGFTGAGLQAQARPFLSKGTACTHMRTHAESYRKAHLHPSQLEAANKET